VSDVNLAGKFTALGAAVARIRSPEFGVIGQGMRFVAAGGTAALISLAATITLAEVVGLPFEVAFVLGYSAAVSAHFTLQRVFVWRHHGEFALPIHQQLIRYVPIALTNYGVVALAIALLPNLLRVAPLPVYLAATAAMTVLSFLLLRTRVFHPDEVAGERE
jgi:putative flippase GtrA